MKNEPAFPTHYIKENGMWSDGGLTKREYFAGLAIQGLLASVASQAAMVNVGKTLAISTPEVAASLAVSAADFLIAELEKTK
jgi:hypothetical protein